MKWDKEFGISLSAHADYINEFAKTFYEQVKILIDRNQSQESELNKLDKKDADLLHEVLDHVYFCLETASKFHGREDLLEKVSKFIFLSIILIDHKVQVINLEPLLDRLFFAQFMDPYKKFSKKKEKK